MIEQMAACNTRSSSSGSLATSTSALADINVLCVASELHEKNQSEK
jgi:hypothetical protein